MNWFDSHCHLKSFHDRGVLENILACAHEKGVSRMTAIGTSSEDWNLYNKLSMEYSGKIFHSIGLHPCYVNKGFEEELLKLTSYLKSNNKPVALGEIGLDYFHLPKEVSEINKIVQIQKEAFAIQLQLASSFNLPVVIHSRNAFSDCLEMIEKSEVAWSNVLFHCFSEGIDEIIELNKRGGRASFTGIITYKKNSFLREAIRSQGLKKIILETDSPYLSPEPKRGTENEPSNLPSIGEYISYYLEVPEKELAEISFRNASEFYGIKT